MLGLVNETDSILKTPCPEFDFEAFAKTHDNTICTPFEWLRNITHEMFELMQLRDGIGLASPQIGLSLRLFVMNVNGEEVACINPQILEESRETSIYLEGCLSFPELRLNIKRPSSIFVKYAGIDGVYVNRHMDGLMARCFQHELDHLDGVTFDTKVSKLSLQMANRKRRQVLKKLKRRGK